MLKLPPAAPTRTPQAQAMARAEQLENIELLNKALGDVHFTPDEERTLIWLAGWEPSTVKAIIQAFDKAHIARSHERPAERRAAHSRDR